MKCTSYDINISHNEKVPKIAQNWQNNLVFVQISPFLQCAQNTKQFISVDSPSWAEQNGTNDFVVACTVVEIFGVLSGHWKLSFCDFYEWITQKPNMIQQNQLHHFIQIEVHILMMSISHVMKNYPKLAKCPYYRLGVLSKFCRFCNVLKTSNNSYQ